MICKQCCMSCVTSATWNDIGAWVTVQMPSWSSSLAIRDFYEIYSDFVGHRVHMLNCGLADSCVGIAVGHFCHAWSMEGCHYRSCQDSYSYLSS